MCGRAARRSRDRKRGAYGPRADLGRRGVHPVGGVVAVFAGREAISVEVGLVEVGRVAVGIDPVADIGKPRRDGVVVVVAVQKDLKSLVLWCQTY